MESTSTPDGFCAADLDRLRGLARGLSQEGEADDLVQDAWLASRGTTHDGHPAWWRTVLRRRRAMRLRAATRRSLRESKADAPSEETLDPGVLAERRQLCEALGAALAELDPGARELVVRRYCEGCSAAELSEELSIPASTVRTQISRSLTRLRKHLDHTYGGRGAWMSAALAWKPLSTAAVMTAFSKTLALAVTATAVVLAVVYARAEPDDSAPPAPEAIPASQVAPGGASPSGAEALAEKRKATRKDWSELRDAINQARVAGTPQEPPAKSVLDEDPEVLMADLREAIESVGKLGPVLSQVADQGLPLYFECLDFLPESATGKLHMRAEVIGQPELGGVVDSVEVVDDSLGQPEFEECLRESSFAIRLEDLDAPVSKSFNINLDMESRSLNLGTELELGDFAKLQRESPEVWAEMIAELDAETREAFGQIASQAEVAEQYPELAAAMQQAAVQQEETG